MPLLGAANNIFPHRRYFIKRLSQGAHIKLVFLCFGRLFIKLFVANCCWGDTDNGYAGVGYAVVSIFDGGYVFGGGPARDSSGKPVVGGLCGRRTWNG